jgi:hypothetical protein
MVVDLCSAYKMGPAALTARSSGYRLRIANNVILELKTTLNEN